ncbi:MAG: hypothetical protein ACK4QP_16650, partial [Pseudorhizobium sp.]
VAKPLRPSLSPKPNQHALILMDFSKTKNIVASSAAALVGDCAYKGRDQPKSTANFKKLSFFLRHPPPFRKGTVGWTGGGRFNGHSRIVTNAHE